MSEAAWGALGLFFAAVATGMVSWVIAKINNKASPYQAIVSRVLDLEKSDRSKGVDLSRVNKRLGLLENDYDLLAGEMMTQVEWQDSGAEPPPPLIAKRVRLLLKEHKLERDALISELEAQEEVYHDTVDYKPPHEREK